MMWLVFWIKIFELPNFDPYLNYQPQQTSYFLDRNGEIIGCVAEEWRDVLSTQDVKNLLAARIIVAAEDERFYEREWGFDIVAIGRAAYENFISKSVVQGGSTIQQQLVKQLLDADERSRRSIARKIKEVVLTFRLRAQFDKDQILALYLNEIYFGGDGSGYLIGQVYGVEAAARYYFNKRAEDLSLVEAALLAGIIKSPAKLSPKLNPKMSLEARNIALKKVFRNALKLNITISENDYQELLKEQIKTKNEFALSCQRAPHAIAEVRKVLNRAHRLFFDAKEIEEIKENASETKKERVNYSRLGIRVFTTFDWEVQRLGTEGVNLVLANYKKRQGDGAIDAEAAFVAIENGTGAILAMVGGSDYSKRKFNHAVQAKRQSGSTFKPIVYAVKFEEELAEGVPYDKLLDQKISNDKMRCKMVANPVKSEDWWEPRNFDEKKFDASSYTRRFAIAQSINRPAVHAAKVGKCGLNPAIPVMASRLGIESKIDPYLSSALGSSNVSVLELARAYSVFPNHGIKKENYIISKIVDGQGKIIYEKTKWKSTTVISKVLAGIMVEALRGVVKFGTSRSLDTMSQPTAGKTGTTENYIDAWFVGFTPEITAATWMGGPENYKKSLGDKETGSKVIPAFKHVIEQWYKGSEPSYFFEESKEYFESLVNPLSFDKEMELLQNSDSDTEAPQ